MTAKGKAHRIESLEFELAAAAERVRVLTEALQLVQNEINDVGEDGSEMAFSEWELATIAKALAAAAEPGAAEPITGGA